MPSIAQSRQEVKDGSTQGVDHDAILANLQDEIDQHNAVKESLRKDSRRRQEQDRSDRTMRFRFKGEKSDGLPRDSKRRQDRHEHKKKRRKREHSTTASPEAGAGEEKADAHPFPREPAAAISDEDAPAENPFLDSLLDALASDEAAAYWEGVYSQPIHVYQRPPTSVEDTMSDAEYADYVKTKMWERSHPEIVAERRKREAERKREEEDRTRKREEFIRGKEQNAWQRSQSSWRRTKSADDSDEDAADSERKFTGHGNLDPRDHDMSSPQQQALYATAWKSYISAWESLTLNLSDARSFPPDNANSSSPLSAQIPYPILPGLTSNKASIVDFFAYAPEIQHVKSKLQLLKAERVKWHPDKMQQRFNATGGLDELTLKKVTGVFQVIDSLVEDERKRVERL